MTWSTPCTGSASSHRSRTSTEQPTPEGIAGWWTTDTTGKSQVGGTLTFRFGEVGGFDMEVLELDPSGRVRWRVTDGAEEWIGTEIDWRIDQREKYTIV